jgi:hypothetical protein
MSTGAAKQCPVCQPGLISVAGIDCHGGGEQLPLTGRRLEAVDNKDGGQANEPVGARGDSGTCGDRVRDQRRADSGNTPRSGLEQARYRAITSLRAGQGDGSPGNRKPDGSTAIRLV